MKLIETYKDWVNELIGYTNTSELVAVQNRQLIALRNLTFDALDQLEFGKPLPEIFKNFKLYSFAADLSFAYNKRAYPLFLYTDDNNRLIAVSTKFQYKNIEDHSDQDYPRR